jgi:hypothetical protein
MNLQNTTIDIPTHFGVTARNLFTYHDDPPSNKLLVMLPGRGYTCDYPLLYALRAMALQNGFDVLSVQYGFQAANIELTAEHIPHLQDEVAKVVEPVFSRGYSHICIAGKSLGTPLAAELARNVATDEVSVIMLTPVAGAVEGIKHQRTLAISGTADSLFARDLLPLLNKQGNLTWRVFDGLNHSLEVKNDWRASLAILPEIIATCENFMTQV